MAKLKESLTLSTGLGGSYSFTSSDTYTEIFNKKQKIDNSDGFITLIETSKDIAANKVSGLKSFVVKNNGNVAIELQMIVNEYLDNSNVDDANSVDLGPGSATVDRYITTILGAGEYLYLPNMRWIAYAEDASGANAKPTTNGAYLSLASALEVDSGTLINQADFEDDSTTLTVDDGGLFRVGDLIQVGINDTTITRQEVMRVTSIATHVLSVDRALYGTSAADKDNQTDGTSGAVNNAKVYFPIFNAYHNYNKYTVVQTDSSGKFKAMNFFGYGRVTDSTSDGIVPGSIAGKFYQPGYQELGMTGVTASTESGLSASTAYDFGIAVDGGSAYTLTFTTDASNTKFGGTNGILKKIQTIFDTQFYTAGNLFEKKVTVSIVNGDIRFTSGSFLSTSAIALSDTAASADPWGVGRWPAFASIAPAVAAKLPDDTIMDTSGLVVPNISAFFYDDGNGRIKGTASGTINYDTGKIDFTGPPNAEFVITANYDSAHGGESNTTDNSSNMITSISARSCNSKINVPVQVIAFN